ncbi:hypothetical protein MBSPM3_v1c1890 [Maize bushy stunt phytoplasma]|uniref:Uncharacterized protein n=1 Tax=Maize bushy stunt phytoplasma TaxID=202462 RepID=A0ABM6DLU4_9MOLU|nr:hypothetical protein [Maize bushy stunt phytoplasma]AOF54715.1 hypothetical protein MBSPM3_v1c1890 [Maize bushy stunt phytoplasma]
MLTDNNKKWQCVINGGEQWKKVKKALEQKKIEYSDPIQAHPHYFNIITNFGSSCFSFIWIYYIGGNLFRQMKLTRMAK